MAIMWAIKQLCVPLRYLAIQQGRGFLTSKRMYDIVIPAILSVATVFLLTWSKTPVGFLSEKGIVVGIINLLNLIIAFFIAALAAVATFTRPGLDDKMKGDPAYLELPTAESGKQLFELTNRQFVCYLFGYLSFASLLLLIGLHFLRLFGPTWAQALPTHPDLLAALKVFVAGIFFFIVWQLVVTMFLGIFFLCDRLQFLDNKQV